MTLVEILKNMVGKEMPEQAPPVTKWLNFVLRKVERGHVIATMEVRPDMANPLGLLHGGVQATLLDEIIGMTVHTLEKDKPSVSVNLSIDFLGKARVGETIEVEARVVRQGRQLIHAVGEIRNAEGKLIAKASSNMLNIEPK
jgi:uncharacterized protein (TIGR00369 family)